MTKITTESQIEALVTKVAEKINNLFINPFPVTEQILIPDDFENPFTGLKLVRQPSIGIEMLGYKKSNFIKFLGDETIKYVDKEKGNDSNSGDDWANAYKTLFKLATSPFDKAYINAGDYPFLQVILDNDAKLIGVNGDVNVFSGVSGDERTWADEGGGVWSNSFGGGVNNVVDKTVLDDDGDYSVYSKKTNLSDVENEAGSFWKDAGGGVLYIHTLDGLTPNRVDLFVIVNYQTITAGKSIYAEGINFIGGLRLINGTSDKNKIYLKNCSICYSHDNGFTVRGNADILLEKTVIYKNILDGLNYKVESGHNPNIIELNILSYGNGTSATAINNASSAHDSVKIIRIGSTYHSSYGRVVHDINNVKCLNIDCVVYNSLAVGVAKVAFSTSTNSSTVKMWLDGCRTYDDDGTIGVSNDNSGSFVYVRNSKIKNIEPGILNLINY